MYICMHVAITVVCLQLLQTAALVCNYLPHTVALLPMMCQARYAVKTEFERMQPQIYQQMLREDLLTDPGVGEQTHYNCLMRMYSVQTAHHSSGTILAATFVYQVLTDSKHYNYVHAADGTSQ